jgi:hypothetical protein
MKVLLIALCLVLGYLAVANACGSTPTCLTSDAFVAPYLNVTAPKTSLVTPGVLTLTISSSLLNIVNSTIQFDIDTPTVNRTSYCDYFLGQCSANWTITSTNGGCNVDYQAVFPYIDRVLRECFHLATDVTAAVLNRYTVYESNIRVTNYRNGSWNRGYYNGTNFSTVLKFQLYFPLNVTLALSHNDSAYTAAFAVPNVISQSFNSVNQYTTITITTSLNPPYMMADAGNGAQLSPSSAVANNTFATQANGDVAVTQLAGNCPADNTSICVQNWQIVLQPTGGQCVVATGASVTWDITCRPTSASVPVSCTNLNALFSTTPTMTWNLLTNNFCVQTIDAGALTGVLQPYSDPGLTIPQPTFLYGQTAYFAATVNYNYGPQIVAVQFNEMDITSDGMVPLLTSDYGRTAQFNYTSLNATTIFLSFLVSPFIITLTNPDSFQNVNITVSITVTYSIATGGKEPTLQSKNFRLQSSSTTAVGTTISVGSAPTSEASSSSTSAVSYIIPIASGVGGFIALTALVVLLRRRWFKSEKANSELPALPKEEETAETEEENAST